MNTLGIDLGTINTVACLAIENELSVVMPAEGATIEGLVFPSYVEFDMTGKPVNIGKLAWQNYRGGWHQRDRLGKQSANWTPL